MKKIVTIGGGNGQSLLLKGLVDYDLDISAIVSMIDNGGSTGKIRQDYNVLPSGDIRRCLIALAKDNSELQEAMGLRFADGFLKDHNFGNLIMLALEKQLGSYEEMIDYLSQLLKIKGQAIPVTLDKTNLMGELEDGTVIKGEANIDVPKHNADLKINKVYLEKDIKVNPKAVKAILQADLIVYTIGDLYTSIIPNLLVNGIDEAVSKSKAKKVFTINRTNKKGETHGFTSKNFVETLKKYLGDNSLDYIIVDKNQDEPDKGYELVKFENVEEVEVIKADVSSKEDRNHIDGHKLAKAIFDLCQYIS